MTHTGSATVARYGEWRSPISAELAAATSGGVNYPSIVSNEVWWCSADPRTATVRLLRCRPGQAPSEVLGPEWSVRNRSLGYGGRPYLTRAGVDAHLLVFTNHHDQRVYRAEVGRLDQDRHTTTTPTPLTPPDTGGYATHYADPVLGPSADEVWCVREATRPITGPGDEDPAPRTARQIVAIPLDGSAADDPDAVRVVATSHHFLSGVRVSPDGRRLAWIGWNHPSMPWDGTELMVADLADGVATGATSVLGGREISVPQAEWADPDTLYAMADPDGWWNLHRIRLEPGGPRTDCVLPMPRDCAGPLWRVGSTWFAVTPAGMVVRHGVGAQQLALWSPTTGMLRDLAPGWAEFGSDLGGTGRGDAQPAVVVIAGSAARGSTVLYVPLPATSEQPAADPIPCTIASHRQLRPWNPAGRRRVAPGVDGRDVHYVYYPPTSPDFVGPADAAPPLLVHAHGGPTSSTAASPDIEFGFFCSRGFAVASVDYGGSTGYGREYRNRLRRNWGIVDVEDCVAVARHLAAHGLADPSRTAVRGGSAGGWTSLACLASTDVFCAGAVYYPISDPLTWSGGATHDFESRYVRSLVGDLPAELGRYLRVSPLANADRIRSPLVMLQGADDFICKPDQAQQIVDAVAARGLWHRYLVFDGEGHGFRKESSVAASLRAEAELYSEAMGITVDPSGWQPCARSGPVTVTTPAADSTTSLARPPALRPGDRVAVLTSSSPADPARLPHGLEALRFAGLEPVVYPSAYDPGSVHHYLAGSDGLRAGELRSALLDESIAGVIFARGGYGAQRTLEVMDWSGLEHVPPKILSGFSDVTAILEAVAVKLGWASLMSAMVSCAEFSESYTFSSMLRCLMWPERARELHYDDAVTVVGGTAQGVTLGGNLTLLTSSLGTDTCRPAQGGILLIEDEQEEDYRVDRMLTQLRRSGYLDGVAAVIAGTWHDCGTADQIHPVLVDRLSDLGVPVIAWANVGHGGHFQSFPIGVRAEVDADARTLRLREPPLVPFAG